MARLVVLPFAKSIEIAYKSIQARFFRSLVTTLTLVLAVSFLTFSQVNINIADSLLANCGSDMCHMLMRCGYDISPGDTSLAASPKQRWIVILSLLVCVVGIINAQLMSVTERFREIGTMKCLGALDRFIVRLFVIEAAIQGLTGALIGAILGGIVAVISAFFRFGTESFVNFPWQDIAISLASGTLTGIALSLAGVLYPAVIAARMQPVEAMRVEQ